MWVLWRPVLQLWRRIVLWLWGERLWVRFLLPFLGVTVQRFLLMWLRLGELFVRLLLQR